MSITKATRARIFARDGYACVKCGSTLFLTLDHIVPKSKGGNNSEANLQTMCALCNLKKGNKCAEADKIPARMRRGFGRPTRAGLQHHPACDAHYCFSACPIFLSEHPEYATAARA